MAGRPPSGSELVARARGGDDHAYEELVRMYQGIAVRTAYLFCGDAATAQEAAQDGFLKAYRALWRFRVGAPFRPWLLRIVANEARNRARATGRREAMHLRLSAESASGGAAPSPEAVILDRERREELLAAMSRLDPRDREVLACRYLLDLSVEETAAAVGCRRGTVKSRVSRALERLREEVEG